jgi:hypothetical protein
MRQSPKKGAQAAFREAIDEAECLSWKQGLTAIVRSQGGGQITAADTRRVLGGAFIDEDCEHADFGKSKPRWDYVIGYARDQFAVAFYIEVHSAETSEVRKMAAKLEWLLDYLNRGQQTKLAKLKREIHWVASGRFNIPKNTPQYRFLKTELRKRGLQGPVSQLQLV